MQNLTMFLKFHKFKENGDICLPLLNIIGELLCLTLPALFVLAFSTPAQPYLNFPNLIIPPPRYLIFPYLHFHMPHPVMLVLGLGLVTQVLGPWPWDPSPWPWPRPRLCRSRPRCYHALHLYVLVFVVWNLCPLDTCLREFWLFLPAQPLL